MNFKVIQVKDKKTGEKILIKDFRFDPALHEYKGQVLEEKKNVEGVDLSPLFPEAPETKVGQTREERYQELKDLRAWTKKDLKEEFYALQAEFEPEKVKKETVTTPDVSTTPEVLSQPDVT